MQRPFHRTAPWLVLVCLAGLAGCGRGPTAQLDLTTLLPGEPEWLVAAELREVRDWDLWHDLEAEGLDRKGTLDRFFEDAGVDPEKDLDRLVAGFTTAEGETGRGCAVVTGRFEPDELAANLCRHGFSAESWRDHTLMIPGPNCQDVHLAIFDGTAVGVAENRQGAAAMIDLLLDGGESLDDHPRLGPLLDRVDRTAPLWGVGLLSPDSLAGMAAGLPVQGLVPSLDNLALTVRMDPALRISGLTILPGPEEATQLAGQLNGYLKLAAGLIQSNPGWFGGGTDDGDETLRLVSGTLDRTTVMAEDSLVRLEVEVPEELLDQAVRTTSPGSPGHPRPVSPPVHP